MGYHIAVIAYFQERRVETNWIWFSFCFSFYVLGFFLAGWLGLGLFVCLLVCLYCFAKFQLYPGAEWENWMKIWLDFLKGRIISSSTSAHEASVGKADYLQVCQKAGAAPTVRQWTVLLLWRYTWLSHCKAGSGPGKH